MLRLSGVTAGAALVTATYPAPASAAPPVVKAPITPPEDLMREHGVLTRVLLVYREIIHRIEHGETVPVSELHAAASIIRVFIEDHHARLEEQYVYAPLRQARKLASTISTLVLQHRRGRVLTDRILAVTRTPATAPARRRLIDDLAVFVRMYEVHEAREDTVVFPVFRETVPAKQFNELSRILEDEEDRRFGTRGFAYIVNEVADIEKALDIHDLSQFTPPPS
ncbi:hemerythrin domain-containing protein [Allokutzneria albata]|uniref:Hemerythrin-like domain-containing protein n=1 Tax=Allokutzneria albata TaxID=211114 RepID=A0A1G9TMV8_ALLAB|nr:hemerythrin domain-containing protein [Allokutzneria albata]SDM48754.1 Hemerythrin-like domain-containing protein [Allokutzneria albata]